MDKSRRGFFRALVGVVAGVGVAAASKPEEVNHEYHLIKYLAHCADTECPHGGELMLVDGKPLEMDLNKIIRQAGEEAVWKFAGTRDSLSLAG